MQQQLLTPAQQQQYQQQYQQQGQSYQPPGQQQQQQQQPRQPQQPQVVIQQSQPPVTQIQVEDKQGSKGPLILLGFLVLLLAIYACYYNMPDVGVIVGMVAYFPIPYAVGVTGWLPCAGISLEQEKYPKLFKAISTTFGKGTTPTAFQVPDLRGNFIRGMDEGAGVDAGRILTNAPQPATAVLPAMGELKIPPTNQWVSTPNNTYNVATGIMNTDGSVIIDSKRYLTVRPQNIALYAYIKY
jgi:microcystin-dependent protein